MTPYTPSNAWVPKNIVVVNKREFDKLDADVQAAVLAAAATAENRGWDMAKAEAETKTKILADNGIIVYDPSAALVEGLQTIGATMLENWKANASNGALAVLDAYNN